MVLGGATSKIRQQALISLCSQSRHSRPVVEGGCEGRPTLPDGGHQGPSRSSRGLCGACPEAGSPTGDREPKRGLAWRRDFLPQEGRRQR
ncbi:unnamed protein product [Rangifer tarandus platyrhynchus]|uniref:Uncharacterized protein n=1 Tax=Rangifer tarandus platyrhynchus TaxID=3082113 RepID=A0ACB1KIB8_RANTA